MVFQGKETTHDKGKGDIMKTLIVYYSLEGNTEYSAGKIAKATGADLLKLIPKKTYPDKGAKKFIWGGKSAVFGETPELEPYNNDISSYNRIIIGFPVWASTFAPPIRTFVTENKDELKQKDICVFACQAGNGAEKAFSKLAKLIEKEPFEITGIFIDPKGRPGPEKDSAIDEFIGRL